MQDALAVHAALLSWPPTDGAGGRGLRGISQRVERTLDDLWDDRSSYSRITPTQQLVYVFTWMLPL
jgi:hypothetical protein